MKKTFLFTLIAIVFGLGFVSGNFILRSSDKSDMKKVTGLGGIFFKAKEPKKLKEWYKNNLGLNMDQYGTMFEWRQGDDAAKLGLTQWSVFNDKTNYFEPSSKDFMINYRVADLVSLVDELKKNGVTITDTLQPTDYGKFIHIMDMEGNKIELWEPVDASFDDFVKGRTK